MSPWAKSTISYGYRDAKGWERAAALHSCSVLGGKVMLECNFSRIVLSVVGSVLSYSCFAAMETEAQQVE